ncbi:MAG: hypothetical protein ACOC47_05755 [Alkalispirochaetaceae bacterium]
MKLFKTAILALTVVSVASCATVVKRTAVDAPLAQDRTVGVVVQSDQDGTFVSTLRASLLDRGYQTLLLADVTGVPQGARTEEQFSTLEAITAQIAESGEVQMPAGQFDAFLERTSFDASVAYLQSYSGMLTYLREERGVDVLLVINNERSLRVWAYAYDMEADGMLFSYFLSTTANSFAEAVPPVSNNDSERWIKQVQGNPSNNADARALDLAEDIVTILSGQ